MVPVAASSPNTHPLPTTKKNYGVDKSRSPSSSTSSDERDHNMRMVNRNAQPQQIFSMDAESANDSAFSANDTAFSEVYGDDWILLAEDFTKIPPDVGCCDYSKLFYRPVIWILLAEDFTKNLLMLAVVITANYSIFISSMPSIVFIYLCIILWLVHIDCALNVYVNNCIM